MNTDNATYDVVIIGAGVAGCATAIALKNEAPQLRIAVIERKPNPISNHTPMPRIGETLPPQASQQLQKLSIWNAFLKYNFDISYGTAAAWGSAELYHNEYIYSPYGYGWHLDRIAFDQFMMEEAKKRNVSFHFESSIISSLKQGNFWFLEVATQKKLVNITSSFMIDATGKKASFSSLQNATKIKEDQMVGIYRFYNSKDAGNDYSRIGNGSCVETDPYGWWYSATLPNKTTVISYMTDADIANQLRLREKDVFDQLLGCTKHTVVRLKNNRPLSEPKVTAAHTQHLSNVTGDSWLAVGDAASCYDPISSMGIFKSLTMSQFAAYATLDYLKGNKTGLQKYQRIIAQDYKGYLKKRQEYYTQEDRYTTSLFWKRRHTTKTTTN